MIGTLLLAAFSLLPDMLHEPQASTVAAVSFDEGECVYWTGDVGLSAAQFRRDLKDSADSRSIRIFHRAEVPSRCVQGAKRLARQAGFKTIQTEVGDRDGGEPVY